MNSPIFITYHLVYAGNGRYAIATSNAPTAWLGMEAYPLPQAMRLIRFYEKQDKDDMRFYVKHCLLGSIV